MSYYKPGDWKAVCWVCGRHYKASELRRRWDGVRVCSRCWEPRHPLDRPHRPKEDDQTVPWVQPRPEFVFVGPRQEVFGTLGVASTEIFGGGLVDEEMALINGIVALRGYDPADYSAPVFLNYHTIPGDGGHGYFRPVTGAPGTYVDNNGTIVVPISGDGSKAWIRDYAGPVDNVKWFGAIGDGTNHPLSQRYGTLVAAQAHYPHATSLANEIDWAAIQSTINFISSRTIPDELEGQFDATGGVAFLPFGTYRVNRALTNKDKVVLRGAGRRSTMLIADSLAFPSNSHMIQLGELEDGAVFDCRVESMTINCNLRADLVGVISTQASEGSGIQDVVIRGTFRPVRWYRSSPYDGGPNPLSPTETIIERVELWLEGSGGPTAPRHAIDVYDCAQVNVVRNVTIYDLNTASGSGSAAIRCYKSGVDLRHIHCEKMETLLLVEGSPNRVNAEGLEGFKVTNNLKIAAGAQAQVNVGNLFNNVVSGTAYGVVDVPNDRTLSNSDFCYVSSYIRRGAETHQSEHNIHNLRVGYSGDILSRMRLVRYASVTHPNSLAPGSRENQTINVSNVPVGSSAVGNIRGASNIVNLGGGAIILYSYGVTAANTVTVTATNIGTAAGIPGTQYVDLSIFVALGT